MNKLFVAKSKYTNRTARKVRLVADLIRGKNISEALDILKFTSKKNVSEDLNKTLKAAIANATNNFNVDKKNLVVEKVLVDDAPVFKRGRAISRGRYHRILKRNCHIAIYLRDKSEVKEEKSGAKVNSEKKEEIVEKKAEVKSVKKTIKKTEIKKKVLSKKIIKKK